MADTIELFVANGAWMARSIGPQAAKIRALFGTDILPTAFTSEAVPTVVKRAIEKLNPGVEVNLILRDTPAVARVTNGERIAQYTPEKFSNRAGSFVPAPEVK